MPVKGYCHEIKISEALRQLHFKVKFWIGVVQYNNLAQLAMCPYFFSLSSEYLIVSISFIWIEIICVNQSESQLALHLGF